MIVRNELRDELVEAISRVYGAINPNDPFDTAYEASYVATYILGSSIVDLNDGEENEVPEEDVERIAKLRAEFSNEIAAFEKATAKWAKGGLEESGELKDHQYAIDLLEILKTLK
jgi:hypothetical protein